MARLVSPIATEIEIVDPARRSYSWEFPGDSVVVLTRAAVDEPEVALADNTYLLVPPRTITLLPGTTVSGTLIIRRSTPTGRIVDLGDAPYARTQPTGAALTRAMYLIEELVAAFGGSTATPSGEPRAIIGARFDDVLRNLVLTRVDGTTLSAALPALVDVGGIPLTQDFVNQIEAATVLVRRLGGVNLGIAYEALVDRNRFSDALLTKLTGIEEGAQVNRPLTPEVVKGLYERNLDTNAFTDEEQSRLAGLPVNVAELQTRSQVAQAIAADVGLTSAFFRDAVIEGFFVPSTLVTLTNRAFTAGAFVNTRAAMEADQVVGIEVSGYDPVILHTDRIRALSASSRMLGITQTLNVTLTQNGTPTGITMRIARNPINLLMLILSRSNPYTITVRSFASPAQVTNAAIDARIAPWALAGLLGITDAQLPDTFPSKWGPFTSEAEVRASIAALVESWAQVGASTQIPPQRLSRLTRAQLPVNLVADEAPWSGITSRPNFHPVATSGAYDDLTNKPEAYSDARALAAVRNATGNSRVPFENIRSRLWSLIQDRPAWMTGAFQGTYATLPGTPDPLDGDDVVTLLAALVGNNRLDYATDLKNIPASVSAQVKSWVLAATTDAVILAELKRILESGVGNDRVSSDAIQGMFDTQTHTVANASQLASINATTGFHLAIVQTTFGGYTPGDVLAYDSVQARWEHVVNLGAVRANLTATQAVDSTTIHSSTGSDVTLTPARGTDDLAGAQAGPMSAAAKQALDDLVALDLGDQPTFDMRVNAPVLLFGDQQNPVELEFIPIGRTSNVVPEDSTEVTISESWTRFSSFRVGYDYLENGVRVETNRKLNLGEMTPYRGRTGVELSEHGGATLLMGVGAGAPLERQLLFWAVVPPEATVSSFRIRYLRGLKRFDDAVENFNARNIDPASWPAPEDGGRTALALATDAEALAGEDTSKVLTVKQVHDLLRLYVTEFEIDGRDVLPADRSHVGRINFRTA